MSTFDDAIDYVNRKTQDSLDRIEKNYVQKLKKASDAFTSLGSEIKCLYPMKTAMIITTAAIVPRILPLYLIRNASEVLSASSISNGS